MIDPSWGLPADRVGELLQPYLREAPQHFLCEQIARYLKTLERWNRKVSLTSLRDPAQIVQRHFGESLFLAQHLPRAGTALDLGSGAGFPGIPMALLRPGLDVTLAESQSKKAAFLREVVAELAIAVKVWPSRIENMPVETRFDIVALRAVDRMELALELARQRVAPSGMLAVLAGENTPIAFATAEWAITEYPLPLSSGQLVLANKVGRPA